MYIHHSCVDENSNVSRARAIYLFLNVLENVAKWLVAAGHIFRRRLNFVKRHRERVALRELGSLDDAALKDIGISRGDVYWASRLPSSVNATIELELIARGGKPARRC